MIGVEAARETWRSLRLPNHRAGARPGLWVVRESALFLGVNVAFRGLGAVRAIIVARLMAPDDYGVLATLVVAAFYLQCLDLGVALATMREIPTLAGRGREADALRLQREVFAWELVVGTVVGAAVFAWALWSWSERGTAAWAWLVLPAFVVGEPLRQTLLSYLQSRREFPSCLRATFFNGPSNRCTPNRPCLP